MITLLNILMALGALLGIAFLFAILVVAGVIIAAPGVRVGRNSPPRGTKPPPPRNPPRI